MLWMIGMMMMMMMQGCKPPILMEIGGSSINPSPPSSYFPSPIPSYQPSPCSSSFPSPTRQDNPPHLPPFLLTPLRISNSAPVTPPLSSPTRKLPPPFSLEALANHSMSAFNIPFSEPASPTRGPRFGPATIPECDESDGSTVDSGQWISFQTHRGTPPMSPTFNLMRGARGLAQEEDANAMAVDGEKGKGLEFELEGMFGGAVKPWEGERIHEVGMDELELTLGTSAR